MKRALGSRWRQRDQTPRSRLVSRKALVRDKRQSQWGTGRRAEQSEGRLDLGEARLLLGLGELRLEAEDLEVLVVELLLLLLRRAVSIPSRAYQGKRAAVSATAASETK